MQVGDTARATLSPARARLLDGALAVAVAAALLACFHGLVRLNRADSITFRADVGETLDRVPIGEGTLFMGLVFLAAPAALLLARALHLFAGAPLGRLLAGAVRRPRLVLAAAAVTSLIAAFIVATLDLRHVLLTNDENVLLFQARILETGSLTAPAPPAAAWFQQPLLLVQGGLWTGVLPWGHAALLAAGDLLGLPHLWPHLAAALSVLLTYLLAREIHPAADDAPAALGASVLVATSPFLALSAATLQGGMTSLVLVTLGAFLLARHLRRGGRRWAILAGLAFGLDLHARPLGAVVLGLSALAGALAAAPRAGRSRVALAGGFALGLAPALALQGAINAAISGDPFITPFGLGALALFGVERTPLGALGGFITNLLRLVVWLSGTALAALVLAGGVKARRARIEWLWLAPPLLLLAATSLSCEGAPVDSGPIQLLEALPFVAIFAARAVVAAPRGLERLWGQPSSSEEQTRARSATVLAAAAALVTGWMTFWPVVLRSIDSAAVAVRMPYRLVERAGVTSGLIVLDSQPGPWHSTEPRLPSLDLSDPMLFVRGDREPDAIAELARAFPDRQIFTVRYPGGISVVGPWQPKR